MRKIKGFTLVELLVVIAIIAMLLSILVPSLSKARELAKKIVCVNNLKTMAMGDRLYANDSDDWHVPVINGLSRDNWHWFKNPLFMKVIAMQKRSNRETEEGYSAMTLPKEYKCPADKRTVANGGLYAYGPPGSKCLVEGTSYGINGMGLYSSGATGYNQGGWHYSDNSNPPPMAHCLKILQVVTPSSKFFFMDSEWFVVHRDGANYKLFWDVYGDKMGKYFWDAPAFRHNEGANVVFYDGHSEYLSKEQIFKNAGTPAATMRLNNQSWLPIPGREYIDEPR